MALKTIQMRRDSFFFRTFVLLLPFGFFFTALAAIDLEMKLCVSASPAP